MTFLILDLCNISKNKYENDNDYKENDSSLFFPFTVMQ